MQFTATKTKYVNLKKKKKSVKCQLNQSKKHCTVIPQAPIKEVKNVYTLNNLYNSNPFRVCTLFQAIILYVSQGGVTTKETSGFSFNLQYRKNSTCFLKEERRQIKQGGDWVN